MLFWNDWGRLPWPQCVRLGVTMDKSKVKAIIDWTIPTNLKKLRGFLGLTRTSSTRAVYLYPRILSHYWSIFQVHALSTRIQIYHQNRPTKPQVIRNKLCRLWNNRLDCIISLVSISPWSTYWVRIITRMTPYLVCSHWLGMNLITHSW